MIRFIEENFKHYSCLFYSSNYARKSYFVLNVYFPFGQRMRSDYYYYYFFFIVLSIKFLRISR